MNNPAAASQKTYLEYAVSIHDIDAASETLVSVFLFEGKASDEFAVAAAKRSYGWMFSGNTIELESYGATGIKRAVHYDAGGARLSYEDSGESKFQENEFYQMGV